MTGCGLLIAALAFAADPTDVEPVDRQSASEVPVELHDRAVDAVEQGLTVVQRGAENYPSNRDCFS